MAYLHLLAYQQGKKRHRLLICGGLLTTWKKCIGEQRRPKRLRETLVAFELFK